VIERLGFEENLTLAAAARMMRDAVKDRTYRSTPLGLEVAKYYRWKKNEWGATASTLRDYEAPLGRLALEFADLELHDFEPPVGTERLREFWDRGWADRTPRTRAKILSILKDFFGWAVREGKLHGDPTTPMRTPKRRGVERGTIAAEDVLAIILKQPSLRDRIALMLLFRLALRMSELACVQFKHFGHDRKRLRVYGKGGTIANVPVPDEIRIALAEYIATERPEPSDFLLYPERRTGASKRWNRTHEGIVWEDRSKPLSATAMHRWWHRCLEVADVAAHPMHEARHTAITEFLRSNGNLKLAQQLARHRTIQTTADIYGHLDDVDLERALEAMEPMRTTIPSAGNYSDRL
jgi:site-specific recombinase XerC